MKKLLSLFSKFSQRYFNRHTFDEIRRTGWALLFVLLGVLFINRSGRELLAAQVGVLAWKLVLVGAAVTVAHAVRKQLFPYVDVSAAVQEKSQAGATTFLAVAIVYAAIILSICSGL